MIPLFKYAKQRAELLALFSSCFEVGSKTPSLAVDEVSVLKAKEAEKAAKAAKKAAKSGSPATGPGRRGEKKGSTK